jgi:peptidoglycan hydrolase-like protein with peptidoglycan-binding domain
MKTMTFMITAFVMFACTFQITFASEIFTRYLQKGSEGADVLILQRILNSNPETRISVTGPGSMGSETEFFGELTKQALIAYQKKNSLGNQYGFFTLYSGALDDPTRIHLNNQYGTSTSMSTSTVAQYKLNEQYKSYISAPIAPFIGSISPTTISQGDTITISGRNFGLGTSTIATSHENLYASSTDGTTLSIIANYSIQQMFDTQAKKLTKKQREGVLAQMSAIPFFVRVSNERGVSNPYQIYFTLK